MLFISPGIDRAFNFGDDKSKQIAVELTPSSVGVFKPNWELNMGAVEAIKRIGIKYVSFHAPFVNDGVTNQKGRQSILDNVFDLTEDNSVNLFCLISHLQFIEEVSGKDEPKVLVVHPLPSKAGKSETEIIKSIAKLLKKVAPLLADSNVYIGIENMPWVKKEHEPYTPIVGSIPFFERLMNEIRHPNIGITFDWGHANSYARYMHNNDLKSGNIRFTPEYLASFGYEKDFLKKLRSKIFHLHLHYNTAHIAGNKPPRFSPNYDTHTDLTAIPQSEYENFKECLMMVKNSDALKSIVIESAPSLFKLNQRVSTYQSSVELLQSMVKSSDVQK